jgi:hypothetical protein
MAKAEYFNLKEFKHDAKALDFRKITRRAEGARAVSIPIDVSRLVYSARMSGAAEPLLYDTY